jgi:hypothetical protein
MLDYVDDLPGGVGILDHRHKSQLSHL